MQLESGNNVNNFQLGIWLILGEPGVHFHRTLFVRLRVNSGISI